MSERTVVQRTFDTWAKTAGLEKKSGSWYRVGEEVIAVLELQKSQYGRLYFVNVAFWLLPLGEAKYPKEHQCHVRTRLSALDRDGEHALKRLLDLDAQLDDDARDRELTELLNTRLLPVLLATSTVDGFRSPIATRLRQDALTTGPAQRLLDGPVGAD